MSESRVAAGVPSGGQFSASARAEADVTLDGSEQEYAMPPGETRQTTEPYERMNLETSNRSGSELARLLDDGLLDASAPYQRPSCWDLTQRINLVRSWCQGIPIPAIMVNDRTNHDWAEKNGIAHLNAGKSLYAVVDGKQRVETAGAWFRGDFAVPTSWFHPDDVETSVETPDGPYVTFSGLSERGQRRMSMSGSMLPMTTAKLGTLAEEADLYLLVNGGGTDQTDADMANAAAHSSQPPRTHLA